MVLFKTLETVGRIRTELCQGFLAVCAFSSCPWRRSCAALLQTSGRNRRLRTGISTINQPWRKIFNLGSAWRHSYGLTMARSAHLRCWPTSLKGRRKELRRLAAKTMRSHKKLIHLMAKDLGGTLRFRTASGGSSYKRQCNRGIRAVSGCNRKGRWICTFCEGKEAQAPYRHCVAGAHKILIFQKEPPA